MIERATVPIVLTDADDFVGSLAFVVGAARLGLTFGEPQRSDRTHCKRTDRLRVWLRSELAADGIAEPNDDALPAVEPIAAERANATAPVGLTEDTERVAIAAVAMASVRERHSGLSRLWTDTHIIERAAFAQRQPSAAHLFRHIAAAALHGAPALAVASPHELPLVAYRWDARPRGFATYFDLQMKAPPKAALRALWSPRAGRASTTRVARAAATMFSGVVPNQTASPGDSSDAQRQRTDLLLGLAALLNATPVARHYMRAMPGWHPLEAALTTHAPGASAHVVAGGGLILLSSDENQLSLAADAASDVLRAHSIAPWRTPIAGI